MAFYAGKNICCKEEATIPYSLDPPHTQKETRDIAKILDNELKILYPISWSALVKDCVHE